MDRWMDDGCMDQWTHGKVMLLLHTLTMRGNDVAGLVEFQSSGLGGDGKTDRWTDGHNIAHAHSYHEGK